MVTTLEFMEVWQEAYDHRMNQTWIAEQLDVTRQSVSFRAYTLRKRGIQLPQLSRDRVEAGKKAARTNKERYGEDWHAKIGAIGGKKGVTGGFFANRELARTAGAKGGRISRRIKVGANE